LPPNVVIRVHAALALPAAARVTEPNRSFRLSGTANSFVSFAEMHDPVRCLKAALLPRGCAVGFTKHDMEEVRDIQVWRNVSAEYLKVLVSWTLNYFVSRFLRSFPALRRMLCL